MHTAGWNPYLPQDILGQPLSVRAVPRLLEGPCSPVLTVAKLADPQRGEFEAIQNIPVRERVLDTLRTNPFNLLFVLSPLIHKTTCDSLSYSSFYLKPPSSRFSSRFNHHIPPGIFSSPRLEGLRLFLTWAVLVIQPVDSLLVTVPLWQPARMETDVAR